MAMPSDGIRCAEPLLRTSSVGFQPPESMRGEGTGASLAARYASASPVLVGLIGSGIQASRTPAMHEREGAELGLRYIYKLIDLDALHLGPEALPELVTAARRMGFAGLNVTYPCKQAIIPLLDELTPDAEALGAVNTVVLRDGRSIGHNTDWWGFAESFKRELADVARERVVQFGAGGAGAAVAHALLTLGVEQLVIVDTDQERAARLAAELCGRFGAGRAALVADPAEAVAGADGVVNTTPVGMAKYPGMALPPHLLHRGLWVADIVYFPLETELLRTARTLGCRTMGGGGMAVFQAVGAFRLFTGAEPDPERMRRHFQSM
jgi:shikimate dehydrogenase